MGNEKVNIKVPLPNQLVKELSLKAGDDVTLSIKHRDILIDVSDEFEEVQTFSLRWFLVPTVIASIIFFSYCLIKNLQQIPLTGKDSIASMVLIVGVLSGICSFVLTFIKVKKGEIVSLSKLISWRDFPAILVSFIIMALLSVLVSFKLLEIIFMGASFDHYTATLLFFIFTAVINYLLIYSALSITSEKLIKILIVVIIGGVLFSVCTNQNQQWWQFHFSFLGTSGANNKWSFNLTLIFSSLLMVALIDCLFEDLKRVLPNSKRLFILRILLILTALDLGAVGLFPYTNKGMFKDVHNTVAEYLVYLIIILIVGIKWLLPKVTKEFMLISYLIVSVLIGLVILFMGVGYLSLTVFELFSFVLAFSWIILLLQTLLKIAQGSSETFQVKIEE